VLAASLGAALGLERSLAGKHAGMRTYALVSTGSAMFVVVGTLAGYELAQFTGINPLQIAGNVVLGVGFLGTGLAVSRGDHPGELTTAAGLWVAAGIGMAAGFGFSILAFAGALIAIIILSFLMTAENSLRSKYGYSEEKHADLDLLVKKSVKTRQKKTMAVE
jgi:putative Mg2+ transporter-C (MgtC) family protein